MTTDMFKDILTKDKLAEIFPPGKSNEFFEALFGDADEGAYDIELAYRGTKGDTLTLELLLHERPGRCLACNLTQGLPQVFSRHPIINVSGIVTKVGELLAGKAECGDWSLGYTEQQSRSLHVIPINVKINLK